MKKLGSQFIWFLLVGTIAAAIHWSVAVIFVELASVRAYLANMIGWTFAFLISFTGHYTLTFRHQTKTLLPSIWRFACVSITGLLINEFSFVMLINTTPLPYYVLLAIILMSIATLTFFFSRTWAFSHTLRAESND